MLQNKNIKPNCLFLFFGEFFFQSLVYLLKRVNASLRGNLKFPFRKCANTSKTSNRATVDDTNNQSHLMHRCWLYDFRVSKVNAQQIRRKGAIASK